MMQNFRIFFDDPRVSSHVGNWERIRILANVWISCWSHIFLFVITILFVIIISSFFYLCKYLFWICLQKDGLCQSCGKDDDLWSCETCSYSFHAKCLLPVPRVPLSSSWKCPECVWFFIFVYFSGFRNILSGGPYTRNSCLNCLIIVSCALTGGPSEWAW